MGWSTIRKATQEDKELLEQKAQEYCDRHKIVVDFDTALETITYHVNYGGYIPDPNCLNIKRNWKRIVERLFGKGAEGIAYGYIGFYVK